ncbi:MAG: cyclic nucleotide-binding domain-containing protein [Chloroflexi bacterium]|nr:cyclic nucleotide-binding domain-containing protein [Chloroflexota bacterium]
MADRFMLSHLRRLPLLARLSPEQLEYVASAAQALRFEAGELVFKEGQVNEGLVLFVSGRGVLSQAGANGQSYDIGTVSPGNYINESALFVETTASVTLRVVETAIVIFIERRQFTALVAARPDIQASLQLPKMPLGSDSLRRFFKSQRENEKVLATFRAHWWAFARYLWLPAVAAILLFVLANLAGTTLPALSALLTGLGFIVPVLLALYLYLEWHNDAVVITDQRVIRSRRTIRSLSTNISEIPIAAIREVNIAIPPTDLFARLFGYGQIIIKTSGDTRNLVLETVPDPRAVQNIIFTNRSRHQEAVARQNRESMRKELNEFLGQAPTQTPQPDAPAGAGGSQRRSLLQMRFINETGQIVYRKHVLIWAVHVLLPAVVILAGLTLLVVSAFRLGGSASLGLAGVSIAGFVVLLGGLAFYLADWDWRNDLYIVGDDTIALIHKRPLWLQNREDQILLAQIDNVISDTSGLVNSLFKMGDVKLLLTGTEVENAKVFKNVHFPQRIQREISERRRQVEQRQQEAESKRQRQAILDYLSVYHESLKEAAQDVNLNANPPVGRQPPSASDPVDRTRPPGIPRVRRDD